MLPRVPRVFTGREEELARLMRLAEGDSAAVAAVDGAAGIGKTALVLHAAHRMRPMFPDGRLYAELRGCRVSGQAPAEPGTVLEMFLRHLGVSGEGIRVTLEERSALFRELLATRRTLLVLDDAASEAQVRPLLPGAGTSLVLITSQPILVGLDADDRIGLDGLPSHQATEMLMRLAGQQRIADEPEAVAHVIASCGGRPFALEIAGRALDARQSRPVAWLAERLADEGGRLEQLDRLAVGDRQVRAAFAVAYRKLAGADARMFRLLGLHPGPDFDADIAASLAGFEDPITAELVLDRLAMARLVKEVSAGRFTLPDLLRLFALEAGDDQDDEADRTVASKRLVRYFTDLAWYLNACHDPRRRPVAEADTANVGGTLPSLRLALEKFEVERANLLALVELAAERGWHETVWQLSEHMGDTLTLLRHLDDLLAVREAALAAARSAGDIAARGRALGNLGNAYAELRRFEDAIKCLQEDRAICQEVKDRPGDRDSSTSVLPTARYASSRTPSTVTIARSRSAGKPAISLVRVRFSPASGSRI
jgi:hypothetical protein